MGSSIHKLAIEALFMNAVHVMVAISPGHGDSIARYHPCAKGKLRCCSAGSPSPSQDSCWPFPIKDDRFRLVMVGRPCPQKGWDYVSAALGNIETGHAREAERLEFVTIGGLSTNGSAYSDHAFQSFNQLNKVTYADLGHIPHEDVMRVMSAADALIMPSVYEPFGLVLLEAMVNGCMVLSSDADGPRGVVKAPWGILMRFQNPALRVSEIERGILKLLSLSREELWRHGGEARTAAGEYVWKDSALVNIAAIDEARVIVSRTRRL
jgi:glycosyltransferase involved in cell wall biosynthesis